MPEELWVPALVAAFVTMAIEFAAKPWLEARKERLLTRMRLRAEIAAVLHLAHSNYGMLQDFRNMRLPSIEGQDMTQGESRRLKDEIGEQSLTLVRSARLLQYYQSDHLLFEVLTTIAGTFRTVFHTGTVHVAAADADMATAFGIGLLEHSRWSPKGRRLRREAQEWIAGRMVTLSSMRENVIDTN